MESISKQAGYLKGLIEGIDLSDDATGKLLAGMVDLLSALCDRVNELDSLVSELNDYVESIDDDLAEIESMNDDDSSFGGFSDDDFDDFPDAEDQLHLLGNAVVEKSDDELLTGGMCPKCKYIFFVSGSDEDEYVCPHCKEKVKIVPLGPENTPVVHPEDADD